MNLQKNQESASSTAVIVAFASEKGGVGKTTITATFLAILSLLGYKVCGADLDAQGHLEKIWGYHRDTIEEGISEVMMKYSPKTLVEQAPIKRILKHTYYDENGMIFDPRKPAWGTLDAIIRAETQGRYSAETWTTIQNALASAQQESATKEQLEALLHQATDGQYTVRSWLQTQNQIDTAVEPVIQERLEAARCGPDIIPITANASNADFDIKGKHPYWSEQLRQALRPIASSYDYIFIDCPPSIQVLTINALNAANFVVIPLTPESLSLEGMLGLLGVVEQTQEQANPTLQTAGVILNKVQSSWSVHKTRAAELRTWAKGETIFDTEIKQNSAVVLAIDSGSLIVLSQPENENAKVYWYLLNELLTIIGGIAQADVAQVVKGMKEGDRKKKEAAELAKQRSRVS